MAARLRLVPANRTQARQHVSDSHQARGSRLARDLLGEHDSSGTSASASLPLDPDRTRMGNGARSRPSARCTSETSSAAAANTGKFVKGPSDTPSRLLAFAVRRMPLARSDWAAAMLAELEKPEARRDIANRLLTEKTIARLVEYASS